MASEGRSSSGPTRWGRLRTRLRATEVEPGATDALRITQPEQREAYRTIYLALRIGELMLSGGAGAGDVTATIRAVARAGGLARCEADVTYTVISVSYLRSYDEAPVTGSRFVRRRGFDGTRLAAVAAVVDALADGTMDIAQAEAEIDRVRRAPHPYPRWVATAALGGLAAAIAVLLGGGPLVISTAFVATVVTDRINRRLLLRGVPFFYQYVVGGLVATGAAAALVAADLRVDSALVVASGLIALLPGGLLVGAVQDAIGGFLVTASARALEVLVLTAGLLTGVAVGLDLAGQAGVVIEVGDLSSPANRIPTRVAAAALAAGLFALANYAPKRVVLSSALVGGVGFAVLDGLLTAGVARPTAAAASAVLMGVVCHVLSDRVRISPLLVLVPAIIPQLPGLTIFRGLLALSEGLQTTGFSLLLSAVSIGFALAAGVIFGEILAQPVRREADRLERRMGPRLLRTRRGA